MAPSIRHGRCASPANHRQRGFGLLWALVCVAVMGIYLARVGTVWSTQVQRSREAELLRNGDAIRKAIQSYVRADASGTFPRSFDDLLGDPRVSFARRHLRQPYVDPMTGGDWELIRGAQGELYGVYSRAEGEPLKQDDFPPDYQSFVLKKSYQEWKFAVYPGGGMMRR
ncbi:type II secretion system protein [Lysobacter arvi]|uniref:Type II secretion system protein n=1 Tax=Lysobacter arvi TaxID=3038776 RepID=A0ABU1CBW7_9GAMM|nr:type II secretion system protein [Lysobacter arvi]MDR0182580.1 type II secretion system protein [Lysobacter arvi]